MMHEIEEKKNNQEHAYAIQDFSLVQIDDKVIKLIRERMTTAVGKHSKAFELEINNTSNGSFFDICKNIKNLSDDSFKSETYKIAELLAKSQKKNNIPGGYLIFIDCETNLENKRVYIVIKAELHEALKKNNNGNKTKIDIVDDVFLSPSQKLFKIGIIYERDDESFEYPNNEYGAFLYDDQFRLDAKPAEYFYDSFLGFSTSNNSKLQTKKGFEMTTEFIIENEPDYNKRNALLNVLKSEFTSNQEKTFTPSEFANSFFDTDELRDLYDQRVANDLPPTFTKDTTLIKTQLDKKKVLFKDNIVVSGPDKYFDLNVQVLTNIDQLSTFETENSGFTLLKIKGKPYQNE